jgi:acylphosphatase
MDVRTINARIYGRVQGVAFRYHTKRKADSLGVAGWVKNRSDGSVEAMVTGEAGKLADMIAWLHHGPTSAVVKEVQVTEVVAAEAPHSGFEITF